MTTMTALLLLALILVSDLAVYILLIQKISNLEKDVRHLRYRLDSHEDETADIAHGECERHE